MLYSTDKTDMMSMVLILVAASMSVLVSVPSGLISLTCNLRHPTSTSPNTVVDMIHPPIILSINGRPFTDSATATSNIDSAMLNTAMRKPIAPH
jgi:hypothetical protein